MKKFITTLAIAATSFAASAQIWKIDPAHTGIHFSAKYLLVSEVEGQFKKIDGTVNTVKPDWTDLNVNIIIDVNSLTTDNDMRDNHLKSDDFFNAEKFPTITFKSTSMKMVDSKNYIMKGELTIRDVTKIVEIPVKFGGIVKDPWGNVKAGFKGVGQINRKDFNLKYSNLAATGEAVVSDLIDFRIDVILVKQ